MAETNAAHEFIAKMSVPKFLKKVAPFAKTFHLVTQNVDRLFVTALQTLTERLSQEIVESANTDREKADFVFCGPCPALFPELSSS